GASRSCVSIRNAARVFSKAAADWTEKGKRITAAVLGTPADRVTFTDGRFVSRDTNRNFDLFELAAEAARMNRAGDLAHELAVVADNGVHDPGFPNGCAVCEVGGGPETRQVALCRF